MARLEPLDPKTEKFLAQFKPRTRQSYRNRIKTFSRDTGIADVLSWIEKTDARELKSYIQTYYTKQIENKAKINSVLATVTALRSIATEFGKTIKFRKGALDKVQEDQNSYEIATSDLAKLWEVANLIERTVLATSTSLGYEVTSFISLKRQKIKALVEKAISENEEWACWSDNRSKTSAKRLNVLNPLAIDYLKKYLDAGMKKGSENLFPYSDSGINAMLRRLFKKATINTGGQKIRFHSIRKWLMTKLNEAGLSIYSVKLIMGKEIGVSDSTYLQHLEHTAFEDYKRVYEPYLTFTNGRSNGIKKKIDEQNTEIDALKKTIKSLSEDNEKLRQDMEQRLEEQRKWVYTEMHKLVNPLLEDTPREIAKEEERQEIEDEQKLNAEVAKDLEKQGYGKIDPIIKAKAKGMQKRSAAEK
jgi:integrase/archaellum component FlaC